MLTGLGTACGTAAIIWFGRAERAGRPAHRRRHPRLPGVSGRPLRAARDADVCTVDDAGRRRQRAARARDFRYPSRGGRSARRRRPLRSSDGPRSFRARDVRLRTRPADRCTTSTSRSGPGETVAIIGATGAGKSTLASLVPRFHDPWSGRVTIDGIDLRDLPAEEPAIAGGRRAPGAIPVPDVDCREHRLRPARRVAAPTSKRRPGPPTRMRSSSACREGYDTVLVERGATLSGGERQRLSIARAILKDAPILILDEPTSAIDAVTEASLLEALERLMARPHHDRHRAPHVDDCPRRLDRRPGTRPHRRRGHAGRAAAAAAASTPGIHAMQSAPGAGHGGDDGSRAEATPIWTRRVPAKVQAGAGTHDLRRDRVQAIPQPPGPGLIARRALHDGRRSVRGRRGRRRRDWRLLLLHQCGAALRAGGAHRQLRRDRLEHHASPTPTFIRWRRRCASPMRSPVRRSARAGPGRHSAARDRDRGRRLDRAERDDPEGRANRRRLVHRAGALVTRSVPPRSRVAGNPAEVIGSRMTPA